MLTRLEARESLLAAERIGIGTGAYDAPTQRTVRRGWLEKANGGHVPKAPSLSAGNLPAVGIGYRRAVRSPRPEATS